MKRIALLMAGFLLLGAAVVSASGDLSVTGNLSVGTTDTTTAKLRVAGTTKVDSVIHANGSHFNVLNYYLNSTPTNGIKIKTNIPIMGGYMPTVMIEGYTYGKGLPIDLTLSWYNNASGSFSNLSATSSTPYMPPIYLAVEEGKVVIFIDARLANTRFTVRVFASGRGETDSIFEGWTAADEALTGGITPPLPTTTVRVEYKDRELVHGLGTHNNVLSYYLNVAPTNGIKIKTKIPYGPGKGMTTLFIEGYAYGNAAPIGLTLTWYHLVATDAFGNYAISSWGAFTPTVKLANEEGYVVIFIDDRSNFTRFTVRAFSYGTGEQNSWFEGWSTADEAVTLQASDVVTVPYKNKFSGTVTVDGTLTVNGTFSATTKNFDIADPRYQDEAQRLVHSSLEGPEIGVYYRGEVALEQGRATILLPDYFEALTRKENRTVLLTPKLTVDGEPLCNVAASAVVDGKFTVRAFGVADPAACNHPVYWEVKAERSDVDQLQVEQGRAE